MQKAQRINLQATSAQNLLNYQEETSEAYNYLKNIDYSSQIEYFTKLMQNHIKNKSNSNKGNFDFGDLADFSFSSFENINELVLENADIEKESFFNRKEIESFSKEYNDNYIEKLLEKAANENKLIKKQEHKNLSNSNVEFIKDKNFNEELNQEKENMSIKGLDSNNKNPTNESIKVNKISNAEKLDKILTKNKEVAKIDSQIEEELNKEIFNYTKNMKKYATSFNDVLSKDNRTLNKIETTQIDGKKRTETQMKKLNEFNYDLKIGFFKLVFMFLFVFISFVIGLLMIRIFPKLV